MTKKRPQINKGRAVKSGRVSKTKASPISASRTIVQQCSPNVETRASKALRYLPDNDQVHHSSGTQDLGGRFRTDLEVVINRGESDRLRLFNVLIDTGCLPYNLFDLGTLRNAGIDWTHCKPQDIMFTVNSSIISYGYVEFRCRCKPSQDNPYIQEGYSLTKEVFQVVDLGFLDANGIIGVKTICDRNLLWKKEERPKCAAIISYVYTAKPTTAKGPSADKTRQEAQKKHQQKDAQSAKRRNQQQPQSQGAVAKGIQQAKLPSAR